jgi:hypothetical protein
VFLVFAALAVVVGGVQPAANLVEDLWGLGKDIFLVEVADVVAPEDHHIIIIIILLHLPIVTAPTRRSFHEL